MKLTEKAIDEIVVYFDIILRKKVRKLKKKGLSIEMHLTWMNTGITERAPIDDEAQGCKYYESLGAEFLEMTIEIPNYKTPIGLLKYRNHGQEKEN